MSMFTSSTGPNAGTVALARQLMELFALDAFNGHEPWLNVTNSCSFPCAFVPQNPNCKPLATSSSLPSLVASQSSYARQSSSTGLASIPSVVNGVYFNDGYGDVTISTSATTGVTSLQFNSLTGTVSTTASPQVMLVQSEGIFALLLGAFALEFSPDYSTIAVPGLEQDMPPVFTRVAAV
jgi:hypothetical protein